MRVEYLDASSPLIELRIVMSCWAMPITEEALQVNAMEPVTASRTQFGIGTVVFAYLIHQSATSPPVFSL
jgi:hypothetical protein